MSKGTRNDIAEFVPSHYTFKPVTKGYWATRLLLERLAELRPGSITLSMDLGISFKEYRIARDGGKVFLFVNRTAIDLSKLRNAVRRKLTVYYSPNGCEWVPLEIRAGKAFYCLKAVGAYESPTIEISGIHMHNIKDTTPWRDAKRKVLLLGVRRGDKVLEVGTGLGYTAINSAKLGAEVLTIEKDENVLALARFNPWSRGLASSNIRIVLGDAVDVIEHLPGECFDKILHDPPTFALAGQLYSLSFYKQLHRVLRKGGLLFHYTGAPGAKRGLDIQKGVIRRLRVAGFEIVKVIKGYALVARKGY